MSDSNYPARSYSVGTVLFLALIIGVLSFIPISTHFWNGVVRILICVIFVAILSILIGNREKSGSVVLTVEFREDHHRDGKLEDLYKKSVAIWDVVEKKNQRPASQMVDGEIIFRCANMVDFANQYKSLAFVPKD